MFQVHVSRSWHAIWGRCRLNTMARAARAVAAPVRCGAARGVDAPARAASQRGGIIPWAGADGADARLRKLVPLLLRNNPSNWALIATHLPGRSGRECQDRWVEITRIEAERHCASLSSPRSASLPRIRTRTTALPRGKKRAARNHSGSCPLEGSLWCAHPDGQFTYEIG